MYNRGLVERVRRIVENVLERKGLRLIVIYFDERLQSVKAKAWF